MNTEDNKPVHDDKMNVDHDRPNKGEGSDHDSMKTLSATTIKLSGEGFSTQFKALDDAIESLDSHQIFSPHEVKIINFYRFEGDSDPSDNAILYAIETSNGEKGTLTDAYGVYTDLNVSEFIKQVEEIQKTKTKQQEDDGYEGREIL